MGRFQTLNRTVTAAALCALLLLCVCAAGASETGTALAMTSKTEQRAEWIKQHASPPHRSGLAFPIDANDNPADLVDRLEVLTLDEMDAKNLKSAHLPEQPWSDYYWALYQGELAYRYADQNFPSDNKYSDIVDYMAPASASQSCSVDALSPSEKYDLLVGDLDRTLTEAMVSEGSRYVSADGSVETWMGICHGWSPASYMLPRPTHAVTVLAADGHTQIPFYPSDIKALADALWATAPYTARFIGSRCQQKSPHRDANGRPTDPNCLDTNPAAWHLSIVNQIGVAHRSFVMDASWTYEVWNQPVYSYQYTYFNPMTGASAPTLKAATVSVANDTTDPRKEFRSEGTKNLVGIKMDVTYVAETRPKPVVVDGPEADRLVTVHYSYTLELDSKNHMLGGEWVADNHPNFIWTPAPDVKAHSPFDTDLDQDSNPSWDGAHPMPVAWSKAAISSSQSLLPLAHIVNGLITLSRAAIQNPN